jgi:uncharacterized protein YyaL (SSP411 family)
LLRSWRRGAARHDAYLEDHAALILGLLSLYRSDPDPAWFQGAKSIAADLWEQFRDPSGGFFDTRADGERLLLRPKDVQDNAVPSGNALAALALLDLAAYEGNSEFRTYAEEMLASVQELAARYPTGFGQWLVAFDQALHPAPEVALLAPSIDHPALTGFLDAVWDSWRPGLALALSAFPPPAGFPPLLADRPLHGGEPTAYVCRHFVCNQPVTSPDDLRRQLD